MENKHIEDLSHIRNMMERSSRFISLSGLSGVFAGITALTGAAIAHYYIIPKTLYDRNSTILQLMLTALAVLVVSVSFAVYFTIKKSKKLQLKIWTNTTKKLLINLSIPLIVGGAFCLELIHYETLYAVAPCTLVFYGLALVNASKYTYGDIFYLGICESILGLTAMLFSGHGLLFWNIGFGVLHIVYGILMYRKYK